MMGNRGATNGWEEDAFSRKSRHLLIWRRGELKVLKRAFAKRVRRQAKEGARREAHA
jgi:hypothetical protein